jgi:hypothetical protein
VKDLEVSSLDEYPLEGSRDGPGHRPEGNGFAVDQHAPFTLDLVRPPYGRPLVAGGMTGGVLLDHSITIGLVRGRSCKRVEFDGGGSACRAMVLSGRPER